MKVFSNPEVEAKYRRLGFAPADLSFKLSYVANSPPLAVRRLV